jgi:hypothetical protein
MVDLIIKDRVDSILVKDCMDFSPLDDGTLIGDRKYCNLSPVCKQIGMMADYIELFDMLGELIGIEYMCTGKYAKFEERSKDEKAE